MSISEAIDAYLAKNWNPKYHAQVGDELREALSEGIDCDRAWIQHAIHYMRNLGCKAF